MWPCAHLLPSTMSNDQRQALARNVPLITSSQTLARLRTLCISISSANTDCTHPHHALICPHQPFFSLSCKKIPRTGTTYQQNNQDLQIPPFLLNCHMTSLEFVSVSNPSFVHKTPDAMQEVDFDPYPETPYVSAFWPGYYTKYLIRL